MTEYQVFTVILYGFMVVAIGTFIALFYKTASYGRHATKGWGPLIPNKAAWVIMEAPASLLFLLYFLIADRTITITLVAFQVIWQIHYFHRSFIFPFMLRSNEKV